MARQAELKEAVYFLKSENKLLTGVTLRVTVQLTEFEILDLFYD